MFIGWNTIFDMVLTLVVGTLFGLLAKRFKIPGGLLVGSLFGVIALNVIFGVAYLPSDTKLGVQIISGAFIGCIMERSDLKRLPSIVKPALIMLSALLILNLSVGFVIYWVSPVDLVTALMSAVPGGIADTPIVSADMGADAPQVAVMQIVRQILGIGVFPSLIFLYDTKRTKQSSGVSREANRNKREKSKRTSWQSLLVTLCVATVAGIAGKMSGITAASFTFPVVAVLILKLAFDYAYIPRWLKKCAQILSGCYLGSLVGFNDLLEMRILIIPLLIVICAYAFNCFFTGELISKTCGFTRKEGMLITTPAGASDMALISEELGVKNTDIIILQVVRAVVVMSLFPQIIGLIIKVYGG